MKTDEIMMAYRPRSAGWTRGGLRRHCHAGPDALLTLDDHPFAWLDAFIHRQQPILDRAGADAALLHHIVGTDDEDVRASLVDSDRGLRDYDEFLADFFFDDDPHRLTCNEILLRVGEGGADDLSVRLRVDLNIDEVETPLVRVDRAVGEANSGQQCPGRF